MHENTVTQSSELTVSETTWKLILLPLLTRGRNWYLHTPWGRAEFYQQTVSQSQKTLWKRITYTLDKWRLHCRSWNTCNLDTPCFHSSCHNTGICILTNTTSNFTTYCFLFSLSSQSLPSKTWDLQRSRYQVQNFCCHNRPSQTCSLQPTSIFLQYFSSLLFVLTENEKSSFELEVTGENKNYIDGISKHAPFQPSAHRGHQAWPTVSSHWFVAWTSKVPCSLPAPVQIAG